MSKFLKTFIVGVASGAAATYFLMSEKSEECKKKVCKNCACYKENPEEFHQRAKEKASEYSQLAVDTFNDYKHRLDSGELTTDDILQKIKKTGQEAADFATEKFSDFTEKLSEVIDDAREEATSQTGAEVDDIVVDYKEPESDDTPAETTTSDEEL